MLSCYSSLQDKIVISSVVWMAALVECVTHSRSSCILIRRGVFDQMINSQWQVFWPGNGGHGLGVKRGVRRKVHLQTGPKYLPYRWSPALPGCGTSGLWALKGQWVYNHIRRAWVEPTGQHSDCFLSSYPDRSFLALFWTSYSHPLCFWQLCLAPDETFVLGEMRRLKRRIRAFQLIECWVTGFSVFPLDYINSGDESPRFLWIGGFWPFDPCSVHEIIGY